jgi:hypothetical protein
MKLKSVQHSVVPIGVTIGTVLAEQLSSWLKAWFAGPSAAVIFSVVVIGASIELVKFFADTIFDHWRLLRRLLLGDQYLEGTWFDIMHVAGKPSEVGLSWVSYEDWEIKYAGEDYNLKCDSDNVEIAMTHRFPYTAEKIVYSKDNKLLYKYTADRSDRDVEITGYGELQFHPGERGFPIRHSGHYYRPEGAASFARSPSMASALTTKRIASFCNA